ncbi:MAG TPA: carbohydrate-binding domain-containing protein, partial [Acetobacteraceae bacterium]|nr:carbohydrate-binding domain-containing protein [Acetobacteraceae bacterium]
AVSTTIGTGPDALVLRISQDAFQGSAQYTIAVDGVQQGGIQTAGALKSSGTADTVTVNGNWTGTGHTVTVTFLNDLYQPGVGDRNLHIESVTYDDDAVTGGAVLVPGSTRTIWDNSAASITFA